MSEYSLQVSISEGVGQFRQKFQVEGNVYHQPFLNGVLKCTYRYIVHEIMKWNRRFT